MAPPKAQTLGKTSPAIGDFIRSVTTDHSNTANAVTKRTITRCCKTSGEEKLSQKPLGPNGQFSGSDLRNKNTARTRKSRGQWRAHGKYPVRAMNERMPTPRTMMPAQL